MASTFATMTANTLCKSSVTQIIKFLRVSGNMEGVKMEGNEAQTMLDAAQSLERILSWQGEE